LRDERPSGTGDFIIMGAFTEVAVKRVMAKAAIQVNLAMKYGEEL
jgi:hypothetical protein